MYMYYLLFRVGKCVELVKMNFRDKENDNTRNESGHFVLRVLVYLLIKPYQMFYHLICGNCWLQVAKMKCMAEIVSLSAVEMAYITLLEIQPTDIVIVDVPPDI